MPVARSRSYPTKHLPPAIWKRLLASVICELVLGYGHKGRKTFGGETRIKTLIYADRSGGSGKDGGVIGHH